MLFRHLAIVTILFLFAETGHCHTIHVGLLLDLSGPGSFAGQAAAEAARLAMVSINSAKTKDRIKIELHLVDTEGTPGTLLEAAKGLTEIEKVTCLVGPVHPALARTLRTYSEANQKLLVLTAGEEPLIPKRGGLPVTWSFGTFVPRTASMKALCRGLKRASLEPVGILTPQSIWGEQISLWLYGYASEFGLQVAGIEHYDLGDADAVAQLRSLKYKGAKAALAWGPRIWFSTLLHSSLDANLQVAVPVTMIQSDRLNPLAGTTRLIAVLPPVVMDKWVPYGHPCRLEVRRFRQALFQQALIFNVEENLIAGAVWDALHLLVKAALEAEESGPRGMRDALEEMDEPMHGVMGVFRPRKGDHNGLEYRSLLVVKRDGKRWRLLKKR